MIHSLILQTVARLLVPLILLLSLYLLLYGHDNPGGGFSGGLVAALGYALYAFAYGSKDARSALPMQPNELIGSGLAAVVLAAILGLLAGRSFLTGLWMEIPMPTDATLELGTPLLFDLGIYLIVAGTILSITFAFEEAFTSLLPRDEMEGP